MTVDQPSALLHWPPVPGAVRYRVLVRDETVDELVADDVVSTARYAVDWSRFAADHHLRYRVMYATAGSGWEKHHGYRLLLPPLSLLLQPAPAGPPQAASVTHLVLTRFNLRSRAAGYHRGIGDAWLQERFGIFERYCAPSVAGQSCQDFTWLIFYDDQTSDTDLERLRRTAPNAVVVPCRGDIATNSHLRELTELQAFIPDGTDVLITTRLDNDDALNLAAVAGIQRHADDFLASGSQRMLHNFLIGVKLDTTNQTTYLNRVPASPFLTLFERGDRATPRGVMQDSHTTLGTDVTTVQDQAMLGWLQVVHGGNAKNGLRFERDVEVDGLDLAALFALTDHSST